jgi:hypothetical protein
MNLIPVIDSVTSETISSSKVCPFEYGVAAFVELFLHYWLFVRVILLLKIIYITLDRIIMYETKLQRYFTESPGITHILSCQYLVDLLRFHCSDTDQKLANLLIHRASRRQCYCWNS